MAVQELCPTPARARYGREIAAVTSQGPSPTLTQLVMQLWETCASLIYLEALLSLRSPEHTVYSCLQHEKKPLPRALMGKNSRFPHLEGGLWTQKFDSSFRSPVLHTKWHVIGPYQKHTLIVKTKTKHHKPQNTLIPKWNTQEQQKITLNLLPVNDLCL